MMVKNTIENLSPEIDSLSLEGSMDRIVSRLNSNYSYSDDQLKIYRETGSFENIIKDNIERLKN